MKFAITGATALLLSTVTSFAADLPSRAPAAWAPPAAYAPLWTGFYVGLNAGAALNTRNGASYTPLATVGGFAGTETPFSDLSGSKSAFTGGAQLGYNMQFGSFVTGVEADINYVDRKGRNIIGGGLDATYGAAPGAFATYDVTGRRKADWFGTLRGRVGVAFDRALIFATGGLAYGKVNGGGIFSATDPVAPATTVFTSTGSRSERFGWALGGGVEYALTDSWTIKGEYLHVHFKDTVTTYADTTGATTDTFSVRQKNSMDLVRAGVNYRF